MPVDAVTTSASGVDPHISEANARIQANRVAEVRRLSIFRRVLDLIDEHTADRALGVLGEPGVNVLELNLALDEEASLTDRPQCRCSTAAILRVAIVDSLRKLDPRAHDPQPGDVRGRGRRR